jgi:hypothetical protein
MKGEGESVMKKPTKVNLGSTKRSEVPGAAFGKLHKSPPEVKDDTMKGEGKIVMKTPTKETDETMKVEGDKNMIVDVSTELRTPQENSDVADDNFFDPHKKVVDSLANGLEPLSCGVQTFFAKSNTSQPRTTKHATDSSTKWVCDKCDAEQTVDKMRCSACKSWRGGKRGALKKSESTKKDKQHTVDCGRKPKQTQPAATVAVDCSNLLISGEDAFRPLTAGPNVNDESNEERTID